jgi:hypothetical protein
MCREARPLSGTPRGSAQARSLSTVPHAGQMTGALDRVRTCTTDRVLQLPKRPLSLFRSSRKWRSPRGLRHSCSSIITYGPRQSAQQLHRSVHPLDSGRARGNEPARILLWHTGQYEEQTNDGPRHQPTRPETRPNQRLYVSLGSPPSVAVGSSSARAAHRSRAPQISSLRMPSIATPVKISRSLRLCPPRNLRAPSAIISHGFDHSRLKQRKDRI